MDIYFDNGATTKVFPEVKEMMVKVLEEEYGNPSSMHKKGLVAEHHLKRTREIIASSMKVDPKEITFTSGGTESNNLAIIGTALANQRKGKHIITSTIEHASVYNPFFFLEEMGFEVTFIPVDKKGIMVKEPSVVAVDRNTGRILQVGTEARNMLGRTPGNVVAMHPLKDGIVSDHEMTVKMLQEMFKTATKAGLFTPKPRVVISAALRRWKNALLSMQPLKPVPAGYI